MKTGSPEVHSANAAKCASTIGRPRAYDVASAAETATIAASARGKISAGISRAPNASERKGQCRQLRCIFGNPFRPRSGDAAYANRKVRSLARKIYDERAFDRMTALSDALEDAGCRNADFLNHCREGGHVLGCWCLDLILGKE
jgi:hypothetical protein